MEHGRDVGACACTRPICDSDGGRRFPVETSDVWASAGGDSTELVVGTVGCPGGGGIWAPACSAVDRQERSTRRLPEETSPRREQQEASSWRRSEGSRLPSSSGKTVARRWLAIVDCR